jgi:hypothetical protein
MLIQVFSLLDVSTEHEELRRISITFSIATYKLQDDKSSFSGSFTLNAMFETPRHTQLLLPVGVDILP